MSDEVREKRRKCITGTDLGAILGFDPRKQLIDVWIEKVKGKDVNRDINDRMRAGLYLEQGAAEWYTDVTGIELKKVDFVQNGIFGGSPDRVPVDSKYDDLVIEIKIVSRDQWMHWGEDGTDQVPMQYLLQCAWYMMLLDRPRCDLAAIIGGNDFRVYHLQRNMDLETKMIAAANKFWQKFIIEGQQPPVSASESYKNYLQQEYSTVKGDFLPATDEVYNQALEVQELELQIEALEERVGKIKNGFRYIIGSNAGIKGDGISIPWAYVKGREKTDWDAIKQELAIPDEVIARHTSRGDGGRRLSIKITKEIKNVE